ncbi:50S ribosomal protein L3 [Methanobrevibacter cuticularis]|uniref:Large ribosomal subunit protein uL3 n=1 Tax=Methanobrevibacter cuticularis TaxID=47311 RepID=A0A166FKV4_9EURY|nr:50S ribosomal protein L3 [Methanobrevibacter cuticularis]KZX17780.1 50S ribosomal protein L3 [Methanobrevibacter cuticularis]
MVRHHQPRSGSVAFSPRKRAAKETPTVKAWPQEDEPKLLGLAGYKVGMTHTMIVDNDKNSPTSGMEIFTPVTVLEVPPVVVMGVRAYEETNCGLKAITEVLADNLDENLSRKISIPKEYNQSEAIAKIKEALEYADDIKVLVHTNPKVTSVPKKKPEIFECAIGGKNVEEKLNTALELIGTEVKASDVFADGQIVDSIGITKGKGFQGPVKRWGIRIQYGKAARSSKKRHIGSMGPWTPSRTMWTVPQAGQMGYHKRTEFNKKILKIGEASDVDAINPEGGFIKYGLVKNDYILVKGSLQGPNKRLVILRKAMRAHGKSNDAPQINYISTKSKQGV